MSSFVMYATRDERSCSLYSKVKILTRICRIVLLDSSSYIYHSFLMPPSHDFRQLQTLLLTTCFIYFVTYTKLELNKYSP